MKKTSILALVIVLILSFTITSYGAGATPPVRDLRNANISGLDSSPMPEVIPMANSIYTDFDSIVDWNKTNFEYVYNTSYPVDNMYDIHGTEPENVLLIGLYDIEPNLSGAEIDALTKPFNYTITPNIYGITAATKVCVFQGTGSGNWEKIDQSNVSADAGIITVSTTSTLTPFAVVVDKSTLLNNGVAPAVVPVIPPVPGQGIELDSWNITGIDKTGATVYGLAEGKKGSIEGMGIYFQEFDDSTLMGSLLPSDSENTIILQAMDIEMEKDTEFPVRITFECPEVNADSKVYIFHLNEEIEWEVIDCITGNGTVTATFNSLSPVMIYADSSTLGVEESPETGDTPIMFIMFVAMIALVGLVAACKKDN